MRPSFRTYRRLALVLVAAGLGFVPASAQPAAEDPAPTAPTWIPFEEALLAADSSGKMVLVDVWSARCGWCARMQREVYSRPDLVAYLNEHFETGRLDIDVRTDTIAYMGYELSSAELSMALGASGTPTTVFLGPDGTYVTRLPGFHPYERFLKVLRFIGSDAYREMTFEEYEESLGSSRGG